MAKKIKTSVEDDSASSMDFDQVGGADSKVSSNEKTAVYFVISLLITSLPVYLYYTVFDLSFESFGVVYLPVTILSSLLLTFAYRNWASNTYATLSNYRKQVSVSHKKLGLSKQELDAVTDQITVQESIVWSLYINNLLFFLTFLFTAFYALKAIASPYNYTLSMTISSAVVWQLSSTMTKEASN